MVIVVVSFLGSHGGDFEMSFEFHANGGAAGQERGLPEFSPWRDAMSRGAGTYIFF